MSILGMNKLPFDIFAIFGSKDNNETSDDSNITNKSNQKPYNPYTKDLIELKITMIGESSVGKSSIVSRVVYDKFREYSNSTIGGAFCSYVPKIPQDINSDGDHNTTNEKYRFQVWDTAGQERFKSLVPMYLKNTHIIIIVYDITDRNSFEDVKNYWYQYSCDYAPEATVVLVGNKLDLGHKNLQVTKAEADKYCSENGIIHLECSAKDGTNIPALESLLIKIADNNTSDNSTNNNTNNISLDDWEYKKPVSTCLGCYY